MGRCCYESADGLESFDCDAMLVPWLVDGALDANDACAVNAYVVEDLILSDHKLGTVEVPGMTSTAVMDNEADAICSDALTS